MNKITIDIEVIKETVEALEFIDAPLNSEMLELWEQKTDRSITNLRKVLNQSEQQQEPIAWCDQYEDHIDGLRHYSDGSAREVPLYTSTSTSAIKPWVDLTDDEIIEALKGISFAEMSAFKIAKIIALKLKEKNYDS